MEQCTIQIQTIWRGYISRKKLVSLKDSMDINLLEECIDNYNNTINFENKLNQNLKKKKIRKSNFPSHVSENIVKFWFSKKYNIIPTWDTKKGDLIINNIQIEVKASINLSNSLSTFGPTEKWNRIYFVDGENTCIKKYKIYEIKLSNVHPIWKNLKVNSKESYHDQCVQKRRPRMTWNTIYKQLGQKYCKLVFDGYLSELK